MVGKYLAESWMAENWLKIKVHMRDQASNTSSQLNVKIWQSDI